MALLSMITGPLGLGSGSRRTAIEDNSGKGIILVDATLKEEPTYEAEVTMHPVENGKDVTDHINVKNDKLIIEGIISETPINLDAQLAGFATSGGSFLGSTLGGLGNTVGGAVGGAIGAKLFASSDNVAKVAHDALIRLLRNQQIITIITKTDRYQNMVLTNLSFPVDATTGKALHFTATFQEIRIVKADTVALPKITDKVKSSAINKKKLGKQGTKEAGEKESILHSVAYNKMITVGG